MKNKYWNYLEKKAGILFCVSLGLLLIISEQAFAQSIGFTVSPATSFVVAPASGTVEHTIVIKNDSPQTIEVQPKIVDFSSDGESGVPVLKSSTQFPYFTDTTKNLLANKITLYSQQSYNFTVEMAVPPEAETKEYPMTILFQSLPSSDLTEGPDSSLSNIIGSNMIVLVSNGSIPSSKITNAHIETIKVIDSFQSIKYSVLLQNKSQSAALASGSAVIRNVFEEVVAEQEINPDVVLSGSDRWARHLLLDDSSYSINSFVYDEPFLLGPYTISLELLQDDGSYAVISSKTILALPISLFAVVVFISLVSWLLRNNYQNTARKRTK